jgi:hypothetical protein
MDTGKKSMQECFDDLLGPIECTEKIQSLGLAGATLHSDKKGLSLYNISKLKKDAEFIEQTKGIYRALDTLGIPSTSNAGVRRLWNYGAPEGGNVKGFKNGATRGYDDLRGDKSAGVLPSDFSHASPEERQVLLKRVEEKFTKQLTDHYEESKAEYLRRFGRVLDTD